MRLRVVTAALVALGLLAAGCSDGDEDAAPIEQSAEDAPLRTTSTTAPPLPRLVRSTATGSSLAGPGDERFAAVVAAGPGFVAVGATTAGATAWTSVDGRRWERSPGAFPPDSSVADLTVSEVGLVAVGAQGGRAAAWRSEDGAVWQRAVVDDGPPMTSAAPTVVGLVAVGADEGGASWFSFDGRQWLRDLGEGAVFQGRQGAAAAVVAGASPAAVAIVQRPGAGPELWRTPDGLGWRQADVLGDVLLPAEGRASATALAAADGELLVVGGSVARPDGVDAAIWTSGDGIGFDPVPGDEDAFGGDGTQVVRAVTIGEERLVAVGDEVLADGTSEAVVWVSGADGTVGRVEQDDAAEGRGERHGVDVAVDDAGGVVVVGWEATAAGEDPVTWVVEDVPAEPPVPLEGPVPQWQRVASEDLDGPGEQRMAAVATVPGGWVAVGSATATAGGDGLDGAAWTSPDGMAWEREAGGALGGTGDQQLLGVAVSADGLVAVGTDGGSAAVWTSDDGATWERVDHDEAVFGGPGEQRALAVAALEGGWVAVGADGGGAAVWRSADGLAWERAEAGTGGADVSVMRSVAAAEGGAVAVGSLDGRATAWSSVDGRSWVLTTLGAGGASAVALIADRAVAVGAGLGDDGSAWVVGGDGPLELPFASVWFGGPGVQAPLALAVAGATLVAVGTEDPGTGLDGAAWASLDGVTWVRTPHDEDVFGGDQAQVMAAVAALGQVAVAVGSTGSTPAETDAAVWIAPQVPAGGAAAAI